MDTYTPSNFPVPAGNQEIIFWIDEHGYPFKELMEAAEKQGWRWGSGLSPTQVRPDWIGHNYGIIIFRRSLTHWERQDPTTANALFLPKGSTDISITETRKMSTCPLCSYKGEDLAFAFYCSNEECRNYRR